MSLINKAVLTTGAAALFLSLSLAPAAIAGPKGPQGLKNAQKMPKTDHPHHHHKKHWHSHGWGPAVVTSGGGYGDGSGCGYFMRMFNETGNYRWMGRYYECLY
jgi:hypothetical protein